MVALLVFLIDEVASLCGFHDVWWHCVILHHRGGMVALLVFLTDEVASLHVFHSIPNSETHSGPESVPQNSECGASECGMERPFHATTTRPRRNVYQTTAVEWNGRYIHATTTTTRLLADRSIDRRGVASSSSPSINHIAVVSSGATFLRSIEDRDSRRRGESRVRQSHVADPRSSRACPR